MVIDVSDLPPVSMEGISYVLAVVMIDQCLWRVMCNVM